MSHLGLTIIFSILILAGAASTVLMVFPSLALMFLFAFIYGLTDQFHHLSPVELGILAAVAIIAEIIDYIAGFIGGKIGGASWRSLLIGMIGLIIGLIIFPPFGGIAGLFLGIIIGELIPFKEIAKAFKAGIAGVLGAIAGTIIKVLFALIFLVLFVIFAWH